MPSGYHQVRNGSTHQDHVNPKIRIPNRIQDGHGHHRSCHERSKVVRTACFASRSARGRGT
eukprot:1195963-Prorocentrum_minimum.AAC.6